MSGSFDDGVKRLSAAIAKRGSIEDPKVSSPPSKQSSNEEVGYESRVTKIAKRINDAGRGHREAMYQGAAECVAMAYQLAPIVDRSDHLFDGHLKRHWLKKKQNSSEIYRFLIQKAFTDVKQASKVFTATREMYENKNNPDAIVRRLKKYGGFEGLRKKDAVTQVDKNLAKDSDSIDENKENDEKSTATEALSSKCVTADIDPQHPKITALYSRKFRSKIERLALDDELKIKAVVWNANNKRPLIRITSIENSSRERSNRKSD